MRIIFPKDVTDAIDACVPYLVCDEKAKRMVLKENTPEEIRELHKNTIERMNELMEKWRRENG